MSLSTFIERYGSESACDATLLRIRWPDDIRDRVLARLLALNAERAVEEACEGHPDKGLKTVTRKRARKQRDSSPVGQQSLDLN